MVEWTRSEKDISAYILKGGYNKLIKMGV